MPQQSKPKFADNEKVLCYHGPLLYEAKCVKNRKGDGSGSRAGSTASASGGGTAPSTSTVTGVASSSSSSSNATSAPASTGTTSEFQYFVHYQGWNKNWDEWVPESRILKITPESLDKKAKLYEAHISATKEKKKSSKTKGKESLSGSNSSVGTPATPHELKRSESASTSRASTPVSEKSLKVTKRALADDEQSTSSREEEPVSGSRRASSVAKRARPSSSHHQKQADQTVESDNEEDADEAVRIKYNISLPEELKYVLVSDWDLVVHKKSLFILPAKISANAILQEFVKHVEKNQKGRALLVQEIMFGLRDLLNLALERELLYKIERKQCQEVLKDGREAVDVYGSAHLLRLMVRLNSLLNATTINLECDVLLIEGVVSDFLNYLETNRQRFFTSKNYVEASDDYIKGIE